MELDDINVTCGKLQEIPKGLIGGCGEAVNIMEVYACLDCSAPFHRKCLLMHIQEDMSVVSLSKMPLEEALKKLDELNKIKTKKLKLKDFTR